MYFKKGMFIGAAIGIMILFAAAVIGILLLNESDAEAAELTAGKRGTAYNYTIGKGSDGKYYVYKPGKVKFRANDIKVGGTVYTGYCVNFHEETWLGWPYEAKKKKSSAKLSSNGKKWLPYVLIYGYHKGKVSPVKGTNSNDYRAATEIMVWDFNEGWRTSATGKLKKDRAYKSIAGRPAAKIYKAMLKSIASHISGPSFAKAGKKDAPVYKMSYNYSSGRYSAEVKDSRRVNHFKAVEKNGLTVSRGGYTYRFSSKKKGTYLVKWVNDIKTGTKQPFLVWQSTKSVSARQGVATGATDDTVFYTRFTTEKDGKLKLIKKSENGVVKGFKIKVQAASGNKNGYNKTFTTDKDGVLTTSIAPGKYTVTETLTSAQRSEGWRIKGKNPQTVTVKEGKTASVTLTNYKQPQKRRTGVKIIKTTNNDLEDLSGFRFRVRQLAERDNEATRDAEDKASASGSNDAAADKKAEESADDPDNSGAYVDEGKVFETNKEGLIAEDLDPGTYEVTEEMTSEQKKRYRAPAKEIFTLTENDSIAEIEMENTEKKINLKIIKTSDDGVIGGVEFTITGTTAWGEDIEPIVLTTDEKGEAAYEGLPAGNYTVTEAVDKEVYLPQEPQKFTADEDDITMEFHNTKDSTVEASKVSATTGKELPGASMSVKDAETGETVDKWISTDKPHIIKDLEYGRKYILHESLAPIGYITACDIIFTAGSDEKVTMVDEVTRITFIKKDADTGRILAGALIHIIDPETKKTVRKITTEEKQGSIIEMLEAGKTYIAHEVKAPEGYQLAEDVKFKAGPDTEVIMKDKKKPGPGVPETGDDAGRHLVLLISLMAVSLFGIYVIYRRCTRKNP